PASLCTGEAAMPSNYVADGPAAVGFQAQAANIDKGVEVQGTVMGVHAQCDNGPGVLGESTGGVGVRGTSRSASGVEGEGSGRGVKGTGTPGVLGIGIENGATGHYGAMGIVQENPSLDRCAGVFGGHRPAASSPFDEASFDPPPSPAGVFGVSTDS